jgi:hypothetical protein
VTGHRFLAERDRLAAGVDEALRRIREAFPGQPLTVISPLAEGADRLVVRRVLGSAGARLVVPLPLPQPEYMADFQSAESGKEFLALLRRADQVIALPPSAAHDQACAAAGRYVMDHCDCLIALWDGQPAEGLGGTGEMVERARQRGLPLAWIRAGNRTPGTDQPATLGEQQGTVTFERFPASAAD